MVTTKEKGRALQAKNKKNAASPAKSVSTKTRATAGRASTTAPLQVELERSVHALKDLDESELYVLIGNQLTLANKELATRSTLSAMKPPVGTMEDRTQLAAAPAWLRKLGETFERKFNAQMYSLVCNKDDPDNGKVVEAMKGGVEKAALILAGTMIASFGWMPAIATALAVIVAKRLMDSGHSALCEVWKESVRQ